MTMKRQQLLIILMKLRWTCVMKKNFEHCFEKFELLKLVWKVTNQWGYITISKEIDFEDNFEFIIDRQTCPKCWCIL